MWPDDYSSPGIEPEHPEGELAAFALNALDDAEFQAVFHHVMRCLHCQEVLLGFQETAARLAEAAPEVPLPADLKNRALAAIVGPASEPVAAPVLPPPDPRWSLRRLRRWMAPAAIGTLSLLLAAAIAFMVSQHREINHLAAMMEGAVAQPAAAVSASAAAVSEPAETNNPSSSRSGSPAAMAVSEAGPVTPSPVAAEPSAPASPTAGPLNDLRPAQSYETARMTASASDEAVMEAAAVDLVKQEMADVVEATVMSAQPETEKLTMTSPLGTEPEAKGVLMVAPSGRQGVLMVSGMPADTYQVWLVRADKQEMVGRVVVNDDEGTGVKRLHLDESVFKFREVALTPDERHGPTSPTGEKFLSARIIAGPPLPPNVHR